MDEIEQVPINTHLDCKYLTAYFIYRYDTCDNMHAYLKINKRYGITNQAFLLNLQGEYTRLRAVGYSMETIESFYKVQFCHVKMVKIKGHLRLTFYDKPSWSSTTIYINDIPRFQKRQQHSKYVRIAPNIIYKELQKAKPSNSLLHFVSFDILLEFMGINGFDKPLSSSTVRSFVDIVKIDLHVFVQDNDNVYPYFVPAVRKFKSKPSINILIEDEEDFGNIRLICNDEFIPQKYICNQVKKCTYSTKNYFDYKKHISKCSFISVQRVYAKQQSYGLGDSPVQQLVNMGYLPFEALSFRVNHYSAFDIETVETKIDEHAGQSTLINGHHLLVSIALGSTSTETVCFVRKDSSHQAAVDVITK